MKNTQIINQLINMSKEYLARFVGIIIFQVDNWLRLFHLWIQRYTDFKSIPEAIAEFTPYFMAR